MREKKAVVLFKNIMVSSLGEIQIAKFMKLINSPQIATYPRCIILTLSKIKDKERKLKAAIEKKNLTYKRISIRLSVNFSAKSWRPGMIGVIYSR